MEDEAAKKKELEAALLDRVGVVISTIKTAKHVDQVICSLYSIAATLFPTEPSLISGTIDQVYRQQVLGVKVPTEEERDDRWQAFYRGSAFPILSRVLLHDVALNWLPCFPFSAQKYVYDAFFVSGLQTEVVQSLVPGLKQNGDVNFGANVIQSNYERLLVLCLLENNGMLRIAREFDGSFQWRDFVKESYGPVVSRLAQMIASVPDKARLEAPIALSSHSFFKQITVQLLSLSEERDKFSLDETAGSNQIGIDGALLLVGEIFSRICRRGSSDVLASEIIPQALRHVRHSLSSNNGSAIKDLLESNPGSVFWLKMMESIQEPYSVERLSEQILLHLGTQLVSDTEAYWFLWLLYHKIFKLQEFIRSMFIDKFLLWKVFSFNCLRWILQFAVHECPPDSSSSVLGHNRMGVLGTVRHLVAVWSHRDFLVNATAEQQAYITAAIGLCLETISKEDLDGTKDIMHLILQGVSCRLESPNYLVRKMGSNIALVFSKVIDPKNPLYLDDNCTEETIDWEFGFNTSGKGSSAASVPTRKCVDDIDTSAGSVLGKESNQSAPKKAGNGFKGKNKILVKPMMVNPDEIIDPAALNLELDSEKDDDDSASENSDFASESSLQPYDLSDDDSDLNRNFSQLVDVVGALRKSDDADRVERALDVVEKLVRASPDELTHVASDLTRTLLQVRCSDIAVEGEEDSAEEKRQRALVALLVTCPFESLHTVNKLLYSPNVDISQRIMMLDVMTEAAQELAVSKTMKPKLKTSALISVVSETQPWFLPSSTGPPGVGSWKELSGTGTLLDWTNSYERELPAKLNKMKKGKTRRWSLKYNTGQENHVEMTQNKFPVYAAAFMLPAMEGFDKKRHGVDLLGRDFVVLGKVIHMLGVCMKCTAMHPEAFMLAPPLLEMLRSREICHHKESYVRRAVLFAASCILKALHPTYVASALLEGNIEISTGLEWIRTWALDVAESDKDRDCYMMAMACIQLHAEMALQTSRVLDSTKNIFKGGPALPSNMSKGTIKIPHLTSEF